MRSDKKLWELKTNQCCTYQETLIFLRKRDALNFWRWELGDSGDYDLNRRTLAEIRRDCVKDYDLKGLEIQVNSL